MRCPVRVRTGGRGFAAARDSRAVHPSAGRPDEPRPQVNRRRQVTPSTHGNIVAAREGPPITFGDARMKTTANARFAIKNWDEKPYSDGEGLPRLSRASVTKTFTGDIEGEGHVEYLMMYRNDGSAAFVGLERIVGRIGGKSGTFVLQRLGVFESGQAKESYSVIPDSATGDLRGLRGDGSSAVGHGTEHPFTLDYELI